MASQILRALSSIHLIIVDLANNNNWLLEVMASLTSKAVTLPHLGPYLNSKTRAATKRQLMCKTYMQCIIRLQWHLSNRLLVAIDLQH